MTADDLIPVDDESLDNVADQLSKQNAKPVKRSGRVEGIVYHEDAADKINLVEFGKESVEISYEYKLGGLAFFDRNLWSGTNSRGAQVVRIERTGFNQPHECYQSSGLIRGLFAHDDALHKVHSTGIVRVVDNMDCLNHVECHEKGLREIYDVFYNGRQLLALASTPFGSTGDTLSKYVIIELNPTAEGRFEIGDTLFETGRARYATEDEYPEKAIAAMGHIITTAGPSRGKALYIDGKMVSTTSSRTPAFSLAYNWSGRELYCGYKSSIGKFSAREENGKLKLTREDPLIKHTGTFGKVDALLAVTGEEIEQIREAL
jgi:hypothetical protein